MEEGRVHASFFISETYSNRFSHLRLRGDTFSLSTARPWKRKAERLRVCIVFCCSSPLPSTFSVPQLEMQLHRADRQRGGSMLRRINGITGILVDFSCHWNCLGIKTTSVHCIQKRNCESAPSIHPTAAAVPLVARGG